MVTVGSDEAVLAGHASLTARGNSLLTVVKMAESADLALLVEHIREDLHATHRGHLVEESTELLLARGGLGGQVALVEVVHSQDLGLY